MATPSVVFDPSKVRTTITPEGEGQGSIALEGMAPETFITIEPINEDKIQLRQSIDGRIAFSKDSRDAVSMTFNFIYESPSLKDLQNLFETDTVFSISISGKYGNDFGENYSLKRAMIANYIFSPFDGTSDPNRIVPVKIIGGDLEQSFDHPERT